MQVVQSLVNGLYQVLSSLIKSKILRNNKFLEAVCKLEQFSLILKWKVVFLFSQAEKNENLTLNSISSKCFECIFSQSEILDFQHFLGSMP